MVCRHQEMAWIAIVRGKCCFLVWCQLSNQARLMFEMLPVLTAKEWSEICDEGFLDGRYEKLKHMIPVQDRALTLEYYIERARKHVRQHGALP